MFLWSPGKNCNSLAGKFWFIHHTHQVLYLWMSIYFSIYKVLSMEKKNSVPQKTVKDTWDGSLIKKIKNFGKMGLWSSPTNVKRQWNKTVKTLFYKVFGENIFYFYLKNEVTVLVKPICLFWYLILKSIMTGKDISQI